MPRSKNSRRNTRKNPYNKPGLNAAEVVVYFVVQNLAQYHNFDPIVLKTLRGAMSDIDDVYDRRGRSSIFKRERPAYDKAHSAIENAINILEDEKREYEEDGEWDGDEYDDEYDEDEEDEEDIVNVQAALSRRGWTEQEKEQKRRDMMEKMKRMMKKSRLYPPQ